MPTALFWLPALNVVTEQRLKYVLVFSGFMELKLSVGCSFFTAKALFIGEYQLTPGWDLGIVLALHESFNSWLMWQAQALCQRSDCSSKAVTVPEMNLYLCGFFPWQLEWWNGFVLDKSSFVSVVFKHCLQILSLFSVEVRERHLEQTLETVGKKLFLGWRVLFREKTWIGPFTGCATTHELVL